MKLDVVPDENSPWYANGLQFTCTQCGNCCTGGPGYVWITDEEIARLANHLNLTTERTIDQYCRRIFGRVSLNEHRNARGEHDCVFLKEERAERIEGDQPIVYTKRSCTIYPVRPLQCRTWPFWDSILSAPGTWDKAAERCHGMNRGRTFTKQEMEALRDAKDWPENPPTSGE